MWYKWSGTEILEAPSLDLPGGIHLDETTQDQSPVQGWHWFGTASEAQVLDPTPDAIQVDLMGVTRDAEQAALAAYEEVLSSGTLTMLKLKAAYLASLNAKIEFMTANGGLG
jgi:hypothetical protein